MAVAARLCARPCGRRLAGRGHAGGRRGRAVARPADAVAAVRAGTDPDADPGDGRLRPDVAAHSGAAARAGLPGHGDLGRRAGPCRRYGRPTAVPLAAADDTMGQPARQLHARPRHRGADRHRSRVVRGGPQAYRRAMGAVRRNGAGGGLHHALRAGAHRSDPSHHCARPGARGGRRVEAAELQPSRRLRGHSPGGVRLRAVPPPWRILMLLGLVHLALAQSRHADVLALLAPLFLARPLAREFGPGPGAAPELALDRARSVVAAAGLVAVASALAALRPVAPDARITPAAAIAAADLRNVGPILNDYDFGGYLDYAGLAPFIDGRAELYGAAFTIRHHRAVTLQNVPDFLQLLKDYRIEATLLTPATPAAGLLDQLPEWQRVYADGVAVVHVRRRSSRASALSAP